MSYVLRLFCVRRHGVLIFILIPSALPLLPRYMHGLLHHQHQLLLVVRLQKIIQGPYRNGLFCIGKLVKCCQEYDAAVLVRLPNLLGCFYAVYTRHLNIQNSNLYLFLLIDFKGFPAIGCLEYPASVPQIFLQRLVKDLSLNHLIIRNQ